MNTRSALSEPNVREAWRVLEHAGAVTYFAKNQVAVVGGRLRSEDALIRAVANLEAFGFDIYLGLNPTSYGGVKARSRHITHWRGVCVDVDRVDPNAQWLPITDIKDTITRIVPNAYQKMHTVFTGRGIQIWLLFAPRLIEDRFAIERGTAEFLRRVSRLFNVPGWKVDTSCSDLSRVVRCPGSVNTKNGQMSYFCGPTPTLANELPDAILSMSPPPEERAPVRISPTSNKLVDYLPHLTETAVRFLLEGVPEPGRHAAAYAAAASLRDCGVPQAVAEDWVARGAARCNPQLHTTHSIRAVRNAYEREAQ